MTKSTQVLLRTRTDSDRTKDKVFTITISRMRVGVSDYYYLEKLKLL